MEVSIIFTSLSISATLGIAYYIWIFGYWSRRNVQTLSPNFFFGNLCEVIFGKVAVIDLFEKTYNEFKCKGYRYAGYYFLTKPILVVLDPKLIEAILIKDFAHFTDRAMYINKEKDPISENLISMRGLAWKNMRNTLSPAFTTKKLKMMLEYFLKIGSNLTRAIDDVCDNSKMVDIQDISNKYVIDIITTSFLGIECNSLINQDDNAFAQFLRKTTHGSVVQNIKVLLSFVFPSIIDILGGRLIDKETSEFFINLTKQTVEHRENNNESKKDFMHLLIQLRNNIDIEKTDSEDLYDIGSDTREKLLTIEEIASQIFIFYAAGSETTSSAIACCIFELVQNPEVAEKLTEEINRVLTKYNGEITYETLKEMIYMDMCIKETIRIYPVLPFLTRQCTKDWIIPETDVTIKKSVIVQIPVLQIHQDPEHFPNPKQFDPKRFLPENKSKIQPNTYIPFGDGPHICIGMRIAVIKIKVALIILLKNYKFTLNPKTEVPLKKNRTEFFFYVKDGIWIDVEKIKKNE